MNLDFDRYLQFAISNGTDFAFKLMGAILAWFAGRWLIHLAVRLATGALGRSGRIDQTLQQYLRSVLSGLLTLMLILGILGMFGVQTTSMAALLAGAGLAIGTAWGGLLTHFAAGIFMQVLRPFKVGDSVQAAGANGTVTGIGLFTTTITTADGVPVIVGNNKIFSDNIQNFSASPIRRVDCQVRLDHSVDVAAAMAKFKEAVEAIPGVLASPPPVVEILELALEGPRIGIRPSALNTDYLKVFRAVQQVILDTCKQEGYACARPAYASQPAASS